MLTLLHISDLHFGDLDPRSGDALVPEQPPGWWAWSRWLDGFMGHGYDSLVHLNDLHLRLHAEDPQIKLMITGDVTAYGAPAQVETALRFLEGTIEQRPGLQLGLSQPPDRTWLIPGNHDHWPGTRAICGSGGGWWESLPRVERVPLKDCPATLVLILIDTDSEVGARSRARLLARGRFVDQLTQAADLMGPPRAEEIRVLVAHHSYPHRAAGALDSRLHTLEIERDTRLALDRFCNDRDIAVVLSGHVHTASAQIEFHQHPDIPKASKAVAHLRCGTTLQRDKAPLRWKSVPGRFPPNTALVHRLEWSPTEVSWESQTYLRSQVRGFVRQGKPFLLDVWPRP